MKHPDPLRIAMWSGPRNISTALMRSFENRPDTSVVDEPFYAAYLKMTGLNHPMRTAVLKSQPTDWRAVVQTLLAPQPQGHAVFYQKHMTHHMLPEISTDWMKDCQNVFLIRSPDRVVASYVEKHDEISLGDIGVVRQAELFDQEAHRLGRAPIVVDSSDVAANPEGILSSLCKALGLAFTPAMLSWPAGARSSDGVWAPAWYDQVQRSTGFHPMSNAAPAPIPDGLLGLVEAAGPYYDRLAAWKIAP